MSADEPAELVGFSEGGFAGKLGDRGRDRRVDVHELGQLAELDVLLDREGELVDHLAGRRCEHVRAHDAVLVRDDHDGALRNAVGAGAIVVGELLVPHLDATPVRRTRPRLGPSGLRELWIGEGAPRNGRDDLAGARKEYVAYRSFSSV